MPAGSVIVCAGSVTRLVIKLVTRLVTGSSGGKVKVLAGNVIRLVPRGAVIVDAGSVMVPPGSVIAE